MSDIESNDDILVEKCKSKGCNENLSEWEKIGYDSNLLPSKVSDRLGGDLDTVLKTIDQRLSHLLLTNCETAYLLLGLRAYTAFCILAERAIMGTVYDSSQFPLPATWTEYRNVQIVVDPVLPPEYIGFAPALPSDSQILRQFTVDSSALPLEPNQ